MILVALKFIGRHWSQILVVIVITALAHITTQWMTQRETINTLRTDAVIKYAELQSAKDKLAAYDNAFIKSQESYVEAEQKRMQIISRLSKEVNTIRNQEPPKECQKAIEWAVQNKDDLKW